jgi:hypothetical protein
VSLKSKFWRVVLMLALLSVGVFTKISRPARAAGPWYVATTGNDSNNCLSPTTPCATINGSIGKAASGDTIYVAVGTYIGAGNEVVLINKSVTLSGGWNLGFTVRSELSTIDGGGMRRGVTIISGVTASLEQLIIQNNRAYTGAGVYNEGNLKIAGSIVRNNTSDNSGGGIHSFRGNVTLTNSSVIANSAEDNSGAGIMNQGGTFILDNSTVSQNFTTMCGGGIINSPYLGDGSAVGGSLFLNNSTVSNNRSGCGGGIVNNVYSTAVLQNTIIAGNTSSFTGPDCYSSMSGAINSLGYNIIGNSSDCFFTPSTGDLLNINAGLFPLSGLPGFHMLLPTSPAIDAGNPAGCIDNLGNPLIIDQRGAMRAIDGNNDGNTRCDIGAYEFDPASNPISQVFLPLNLRNYCPPTFFDDFSNPNSGWPVSDNEFFRSEYLNGEYRGLSKQSGYFYFFQAPACERQNYMVEADARWEGAPGESYGLRFGITNDFSQFYLFEVNPDFQLFRVLRRSPSGFAVVVPVTPSSAIRPGNTSNHLKVTRNGSQITLEVNGVVLGTWFDGTITGLTKVGLMFSPYDDNPSADVRFDNFRVTSLSSNGAIAQDQRGATIGTDAASVAHMQYAAMPDSLNWLPHEDGINVKSQ